MRRTKVLGNISCQNVCRARILKELMKAHPIATELDIRERSEYFRGLLLIMAADGDLHEMEERLVREAVKPFGFSEEYIDESIHGILKNSHVSHEPPKFSNKRNAEKFLTDALDIAFADNELHEREEHWLRAAAEANAIDLHWLRDEIARRER